MRQAARSNHAYLVRHFERRCRATKKGLHLPSEDELLLGMGFLNNDIYVDAKEACSRWLGRVRGGVLEKAFPDVRNSLEGVTVAPDATSILLLSNVLFEALFEPSGERKADKVCATLKPLHTRCRIYLAHLDFPGAARDIVFEIISRLLTAEREHYKASVHYAYSALAWAIYALQAEANEDPSGFEFRHRMSPITHSAGVRLFIEEMLEAGIRERIQDNQEPQSVVQNTASEPVALLDADSPPAGHVVVLKAVGNEAINEGRKVATAFRSISGVPLPLAALPDLAVVREQLAFEAPHATDLTDEILTGLVGERYVRIPPTILVGKPGCGKTRYARRLLELLGVKHQVISCGGVADGTWGGTPRRWSTGEPSLALAALLRAKVPNPGIILDEIDKVADDRNNGNAAESILSMLEPESAARFVDPYVQGECDLSHISWVMTANKLQGIQAPFRDRCRVLHFPEPRAEHRRHFADSLLEEALDAKSLDRRWFGDPTPDELRYIERLWRGGSLRRLRKIINAIIQARLLARTFH